MNKITIEQEYWLLDNNKKYCKRKVKEKTLKIDDSLLNLGIRKGLIKKTDEGYVFIGDYEDLLAFKNSKKNIIYLD